MNSKKKKTTILSVLAAALVLAGVGGIMISRNNTQAVSSTARAEADKSMFEFAGADGWREGPSNGTSMALFNSQTLGEETSCFTSTEYYEGTVDVATQLQESQQRLNDGGYTVSPRGTETLTIQTPSGDKEYELHLSNTVSPSGVEKVMGGHAIGYLQLSDGYLKIYGNCSTSEELPRIFSALEAIKVTDIN